MKLRDYLHENRIKITEFAKDIGASRNYVNQIVLGHRIPSKWLMLAIRKQTKGKVTEKDFSTDHDA